MKSAEHRRIRVLVVDDTPLACRLITDVLNSDPELTVVGAANNGLDAIRMVTALRPDVVTMDVDMPVLDGYHAVQEIMRLHPVPILVVTSLPLYDGGLIGRMLGAGALEVVRKPEGGTREVFSREYQMLQERVKALAQIRLRKPVAHASENFDLPAPRPGRQAEVVGIVASTGGPAALATLIGKLPENFSIPILVVQHIAHGFVHDFGQWLGQMTSLRVRVAQPGDSLDPGVVLLAPDDRHLEVATTGVRLTEDAPELSLRPSGNRLLRSLAKVFGQRAVGMILTGMGSDGAHGLASVRAAGGLALVQDEASCSIFGMPRAAIEARAADEILPLAGLTARLRSLDVVRRSPQGSRQ